MNAQNSNIINRTHEDTKPYDKIPYMGPYVGQVKPIWKENIVKVAQHGKSQERG